MRLTARPLSHLLGIVLCTTFGLSLGCEGQIFLHASTESGWVGPTSTDDSNDGANNGGDPDDRAQVIPRGSLHRLNALEYNNSVRDLLGTTLTPADDFPPDASIDGFDNMSGALSITPTLMGRYVQAASDVVEDSFADRPAFEDVFEEDDPRLTYGVDRDANRIGGIVRLRNGAVAGEIGVPKTAAHTVVLKTRGLMNGAISVPRLRLSIAGQTFDYDAPLDGAPIVVNLEIAAGRHSWSVTPLNFEEFAAENRGNDIMFDSIVVRSDEQVQGPARTRIMTCELVEPNTTTCATTVIRTFARRAWRRPLTTEEETKLDALYAAVVAEGETPEEAVKLALRAILTSPKFLYRFRTLSDDDAAALDPYVIASRLSFFIWSSTPDDRLLGAAADGTLSTQQGIVETVTWMLVDGRATAMADGFAEQWLDLRHLENVSPSPEAFPGFDESVRQAMIDESKLFFLDYLTNGEPVASMLTPSFAYRDQTLAAHLGIAPPDGDGFERFPATAADRRGVLALTAWLTARSDSEHASPIRRGAWVADAMLCEPVPPPPPNLVVGDLEEGAEGLTVRQQLERHRTDDACSTCHARLDVIGMGFQMYDGVGRTVADPALDSTGNLPGGASFRGAEQMANAMEKDAFVTCVSKKLYSYALGRRAEPTDLDGLGEVAVSTTATLPDLIAAIATSPSFSRPVPLK